MNELMIAATSTAAIATAIAAVTMPEWLMSIEIYDILATMLMGILGNWSREIYGHFDKDSPIETGPLRLIAMIIPGVFGGLVGGEVASLAGFNDGTWMFAAALGYLGAPAMERITQAVMGLMDKAMAGIGIRQEKSMDHALEMDEKRNQQVLRALNEPL